VKAGSALTVERMVKLGRVSRSGFYRFDDGAKPRPDPDMDLRDVIQRTVDPNLLAITAGRTPANPSELLSSERMKTLITNLRHGPFDWIVIDTPPVLAVTDAVILAPMVAGVTFVIGAEMTRRRLAERALETILASHPKMVGVVLNKVDFARNKYYYSRYYGHQYKNYYAEAV